MGRVPLLSRNGGRPVKLSEYGARDGLNGVAPDQRERDAHDRAVHALIESVRTAEPGRDFERARSRALEALLPMFSRWAPLICRSHRDYSYEHLDDIVSLAAENAVRMFTPEGMANRHPTNWLPYLRRMMQNRASTYYGSSAVSFVSGTTMANRRHSTAARFTEELRSITGEEPSVAEVISYANDIISRSRSDAVRQGALLTEEDFSPVARQVSYDSLAEVGGEDSDQSLIAPSEGNAIVRAVVAQCAQITSDHGRVAGLWLGGIYDGNRGPRTDAQIARETGMTRAVVTMLLGEVQEVARDISRTKFGIDLPGA